MNKFRKVLLVLYSIILLGLIIFLVYIKFFNTTKDIVEIKYVIPAIFAFFAGIIKILINNRSNNPLIQYKKVYEDTIRDSFDDNRRNLNSLLKAIRLIDENKFQKSIKRLQSLENKCTTNNEKYSINLFLAVNNEYLGNIDKAISIFEDMKKNGIADSRIFTNLLRLYQGKGDSQKAYEAGMQATHADPRNIVALNNFAYFLFGDGKYDEAEEYAKKTIEIKNNAIEAITLLYIIYTLEDKKEDAELYARKAIANGRSKKELKEILEYYIGEEED